MTDKLDVFQDLNIRGPIAKRPELREALVAATIVPWRVDFERSSELARISASSEDVVLFCRDADRNYPAVGLTLWGTTDGYYVPNIVPLETGRLTFAQYNAVLEDFIIRVASPVVSQFGFNISKTKPQQTLDDWLSQDAALKLRRFSGAANKSTGASHPSDQRR
jgi:hypothetical protein